MEPVTETTRFHPTPHAGTATALALRLAEAENALHALTSGQIDAVVGPGGQTYLLRPAQEHLRQSERQQQAVLESVPDVLVVVNHAGVILFENYAARRLLGYAPEELVGSVFFKLIHDADLPMVRSAFVNLIEGSSQNDTVRFRHLTRDGSYRLMEAALGKLQSVPPESVVFSLRPVVDRPADPECVRADAASNPPLPDTDRFLAMLSHELRVPLAPILFGIAALQKDGRFADASPTLVMIQRNLELQSRLLDELNDFALVGQHKTRLRLEPTDIHEAVRLVLEICAGEIAAAQMDVRLDLQAAEHTASADSVRLQQVMWNLVRNAAKFSAPGSSLRITSANDARGELTLKFADRGVGIIPELLPLVFDPFQQGDDSMQQRHGGLGLGLFIAKGLIEAHRGTLTVSSPGHGQGTTFLLTLPTLMGATA